MFRRNFKYLKVIIYISTNENFSRHLQWVIRARKPGPTLRTARHPVGYFPQVSLCFRKQSIVIIITFYESLQRVICARDDRQYIKRMLLGKKVYWGI